ncbi:hypothetical protein N665_0005s0125 [Sinapis alba]|nr:hypothetical protein N665_0005s0125 [Sinapis alba]
MQRPNSSSSSSVPSHHFPPLPFTGAPISPYSISQPSCFDSLPVSVEERFTPSLPPSSPFTMNHSTSRMVAGENLPPPRKSHMRSNSDDVTFEFSSMMPLERSISGGQVSDWSNLVKEERSLTSESQPMEDIFRAYMNVDHIDVLTSFVKTNGGINTSESEGESNVMRRAGGDFAPPPTSRHYRSVSMDSCSFFGVRVGNCEFSADEMKKISADEKLAKIVMVEPKRVKRILANRFSAARSKERKTQYIAELEHKVKTLQSDNTTLSAQLTHLQRDSMGLQNQNNELKFRLQAMEQQAQLRTALSEKLTEEVQRLRLVIGEWSRSESNVSNTSLSPEMFQQQLRSSQLQQQQSNQNSTMGAYHASNEQRNQLGDQQFLHI